MAITVRQLADKLADKPMEALVILDVGDQLGNCLLRTVRDGKYVPTTPYNGEFFYAEGVSDATPSADRVLAVLLVPDLTDQ